MSTDATPGPRRFVVRATTSAPAPPLAGEPEQADAAAHSPHRLLHGQRRHLPHAPVWRDPGGPELVRSSLAAAASGASLTVMALASLFVVSLASARAGTLVPSANSGSYPSWMAGPAGALTSWLTSALSDPAYNHLQRVAFAGAIGVMLGGYLIVAVSAPRLRPAWVLGAIVLVQLIFVFSPPLTLTDVFNYLNYGRMEAVHGLNPYTTLPALEPHGDPTFNLSNWHGLLSPYGPLFTMFTMALAPLGVATSFWAMKVALMLSSLGSVFLIHRCAVMLGRNPLRAAVIAGLNPIVLLWGLGGDHNDFLMIFFIVLAFWLLLRADSMRVGRYARPAPPYRGAVGRLSRAWAWLDGMPRPLALGEPAAWMEVGAGISLVVAVSVKASAAVLLPVMLAGASRRIRIATGMAIGFALAGAMTIYAFGLNLPDIGQQGQLVVPNGIPNLTGLALGFGGATQEMRQVLTLLLIAVIAACTIWAWRTRRWLSAGGWTTFALLLTLGWTLPWYVAWMLPFAALARARSLRIVTALACVYMYTAFMPYAPEILAYLHINPATTAIGQKETDYMQSLLF